MLGKPALSPCHSLIYVAWSQRVINLLSFLFLVRAWHFLSSAVAVVVPIFSAVCVSILCSQLQRQTQQKSMSNLDWSLSSIVPLGNQSWVASPAHALTSYTQSSNAKTNEIHFVPCCEWKVCINFDLGFPRPPSSDINNIASFYILNSHCSSFGVPWSNLSPFSQIAWIFQR